MSEGTSSKQFTLPPPPPNGNIEDVERMREIEDRLKGARTKFSGSIVDGAEVGAGSAGLPMDVINGGLESRGFVAGSTGWRIQGNGDVEFQDGVFRGSARFVQPAAKRRRTTDAINVAAGTYFINGLTTIEFAEGGVTSDESSIIAPRSSIYMAACGVKAHNDDTAISEFGLYLRKGTTVGTSLGTIIASSSTLCGGSGNAHLNCSTPVKLAANERIWMVVEALNQWDLIADPATFIALSYSSEA